MSYKNQNYMRNYLLKEEADKAQKGYVEEDNQEIDNKEQETQTEQPLTPTHSFIIYKDDQKSEEDGRGTCHVDDVENDYVKVKILTNSNSQMVNQSFFVLREPAMNGTISALYNNNTGVSPIGLFIELSKYTE
jgi:hypothetical protein